MVVIILKFFFAYAGYSWLHVLIVISPSVEFFLLPTSIVFSVECLNKIVECVDISSNDGSLVVISEFDADGVDGGGECVPIVFFGADGGILAKLCMMDWLLYDIYTMELIIMDILYPLISCLTVSGLICLKPLDRILSISVDSMALMSMSQFNI